MKKLWIMIAVAFVVTSAPSALFADEKCTKPCDKTTWEKSPWTQETTYGNKILQKFYFGAKNILAGWTEIISKPEKALKNDTCVFRGLGKGIVFAAADTVGGVLHLATFPIPQIDVPLPDGGVQL